MTRRFLVLIFQFMALVLCKFCHAGEFVNGSSDIAHANAATNFTGGALWAYGYVNSPTYGYFTVYLSAAYLNSWNVLLAAHEVDNNEGYVNFTLIGTGNNYSNSPGTVVGVRDVVVMPGYNPDGSTADIAIAHLSSPLPPPTGMGINTNGGLLSLNPLTFGSPAQDQQLWACGFGIFGTPTGGFYLQDGNSRAWTAPANMDAAGFSQSFYFTAGYDGNGALGPMNGKAAQLDSGCPWYDAAGNLLGISDAAGQNYTIVEYLSAAGITEWIRSNLFVPPKLNFQITGTNLVLSWTNGFALQSSTNAAGPFADITNAASPYTNAMAAPQMFFQLRSQ